MDAHHRLIVGMASLAALYAGSSHALGLGEVRLTSALSQPLNAVIELHGAEGLAPNDIVVSLADAETFSRVGIERPYFLNDLRFTPVRVNSQLAVRVESSRPVNEPYLNFLVQLHRPSGVLLREYTLLPDPPLYRPAPVLASSADIESVAEPAVVASTVVAPPVTPALPDLQPQADAGRYETSVGDSLWAIAQATRADESVAVARQMRAIRALNPEAFVNGDMDRLRVGRELILPTAAQMGVTGDVSVEPPQLRIEEPQLEAAVGAALAESEQMQSRLAALESRFNALLAELEERDRQITSLQAELEAARNARAAALSALPVAGEEASGSMLPAAQTAMEPGAVARPLADPGEAAEPVTNPEQRSAFKGWWWMPVALVAAIIALVMGYRRREPEPEPELAEPIAPRPVPQPVTMPGNRVADPLEGVELYLTYGRLVEARTMLDKAIKAEPVRVDLRLKQLGVLAALGDSPAFAEQAQAVCELDGDVSRIEQLKAQFPQIDTVPRTEQVTPMGEVTPMHDDALSSGQADLEMDFDLNADWELIDGLGARMSRPEVAEPGFESNLTDFPEVGELDEDFAGHFEQAGRKNDN
ncbi:hypothetical protein CF98_05980 [Halopseudomonas bauzanensis]|nr:hypothetical protein CF98_05980 [Halopseudomonas bauzanensis]